MILHSSQKLRTTAILVSITLLAFLAEGRYQVFPGTLISGNAVLVQESKYKTQPVEVARILVNDEVIRLGQQTVTSDKAWLRGFSVEVRNISRKSIRYVQMRLLLKSTNQNDESGVFPLVRGLDTLVRTWNRSQENNQAQRAITIKPGESVKLYFDDQTYAGLQKFLRDIKWQGEVSSIKLYASRIIFADATIWTKGAEVIQSPDNPQKLVPIDKYYASNNSTHQYLYSKMATNKFTGSLTKFSENNRLNFESDCTRAAEVYYEICSPNGQYQCTRESWTPYQGGEIKWEWAYLPCIDELGSYCNSYAFVREATFGFCGNL